MLLLFSLLKAIPVRVIVAVVALIAILAVIWGGYHYVSSLQEKNAQLQAELATEKQARLSLEDTLDQFKRKIALNQEQIRTLEADNLKSRDEWIATLEMIDDLNDCSTDTADTTSPLGVPTGDVPVPFQPDPTNSKQKIPDDQATRFNRANADVNRMLERIGR